jgi:type II secretory pathway component GspD/PulD (secretin)
MGGMGGGMMGGYGGGMGGMGGGMSGYGGGMSGMGGYGGGMGGGMGGYGGGMGGMMGGGYMQGMRAQDLAYLIQETIEPESWYEYGGEGSITIYPRQMPKKLAVLASREVHREIEKLLNEMRRALGQQVSIEARFLVVSENFLEDIGLDLDIRYNFGGNIRDVNFSQESFLGARSEATKVPGSWGGEGTPPAISIQGGYGTWLDDLEVSLLLRATQAHADSKVLTAPKVTVLSGESASFYIMNTISYALPPNVQYGTYSGAYAGGGGTTSAVQQNVGMMPVGSVLNITPTILRDKKNVLLNILTEQQDLLRFRTHRVEGPVGAEGEVAEYDVTVPETEMSQVMTRVSVPDRGTLLLGGQKITAEVEKEVGVPILSKVPLIGRAFTNRSKIRDHKILLILVKPTIILQDESEQEAIAAMDNQL